jgi:hypothetical protein
MHDSPNFSDRLISMPIGKAIITHSGLTLNGDPVKLRDCNDFRDFLINAQSSISDSLLKIFGNVHVGFALNDAQLSLSPSNETPWESFVRHSVAYFNGDRSASAILTAWCIAADIAMSLVATESSDHYGEGVMPIRYIARGAWKAAEIYPEDAAEYSRQMKAHLALGAQAALEGIPKPKDPHTNINEPRLPWLGELHSSLDALTELSMVVAHKAVSEICVYDSGETDIKCAGHWMRWRKAVDLSALLIDPAIEKAREIEQDHSLIELSHDGQEILADLLNSPPLPTNEMKELRSMARLKVGETEIITEFELAAMGGKNAVVNIGGVSFRAQKNSYVNGGFSYFFRKQALKPLSF